MLRFLRVLPLALSALACSSTTATSTIPPVTGIVIRSESLVAGVGCGTAASQVFKYVATATAPAEAGVAPYVAAFDCFADGDFVNLPAPAVGQQAYTVAIDAFNQADYLRQQATIQSYVAGNPVHATPTWQTSCTAVLQLNIQVLAICGQLLPLSVPDAGAAPDASVADSGSDGATDASDAAAGD